MADGSVEVPRLKGISITLIRLKRNVGRKLLGGLDTRRRYLVGPCLL